MGQVLPAKAFHADYNLVKKYGNYSTYKEAMKKEEKSTKPKNKVESTIVTTGNQQNGEPSSVPEQPSTTPTGNSPSVTESGNPNYTMDDIISVAETGSTGVNEPKSAYDMYMEEAKNIYNQGVERNNKNAANQAASAGAQYREVNRNVNEINKANGKADTGYAGDTSIDAYNAYRNSVNKSYSDANSANNELYSYYLSEVTKMQQAKDTKEATDRQWDMQEQAQKDTFETYVVSGIGDILAEDGAYDSDGNINKEYAEEVSEYVQTICGEDVPDSIAAYLGTINGFNSWKNDSENYKNIHYQTNQFIEQMHNYDKNKIGVGNIIGGKWKVISVQDFTNAGKDKTTRKPAVETWLGISNFPQGQGNGAIRYCKNGEYYVDLGDWKIAKLVPVE